MSVSKVLLALGSNIGNRSGYLNQSVTAIEKKIGHCSCISDYFETHPIGPADQLFLNAALIVETNLGPFELLDSILKIELEIGRIRKERWGNRVIDIDILLWNQKSRNLKIEHLDLDIPHPRLHERDFALYPAVQIAPEWTHPKFNKTLRTLWLESGFSSPETAYKRFEWRKKATLPIERSSAIFKHPRSYQ